MDKEGGPAASLQNGNDDIPLADEDVQGTISKTFETRVLVYSTHVSCDFNFLFFLHSDFERRSVIVKHSTGCFDPSERRVDSFFVEWA